MKTTSFHIMLLGATIAALLSGCASNRPRSADMSASGCPPSRVRFSTFQGAQIKGVNYDGARRLSEYEQGVKNNLNASLGRRLAQSFSPLETIPCGAQFRPAANRTLLIEPKLLDFRVVSPNERSWFTWGAGDSVISVQVIFRDSVSGEVIAEPTFYRKATLFMASWTSGQSDLELPSQVAEDVDSYMMANR